METLADKLTSLREPQDSRDKEYKEVSIDLAHYFKKELGRHLENSFQVDSYAKNSHSPDEGGHVEIRHEGVTLVEYFFNSTFSTFTVEETKQDRLLGKASGTILRKVEGDPCQYLKKLEAYSAIQSEAKKYADEILNRWRSKGIKPKERKDKIIYLLSIDDLIEDISKSS